MMLGGGAAVAGDGLVRPVNAPPGRPMAPGIQPGVTGPVVTANRVVVFGKGGGIFVYNGAVAFGSLIETSGIAVAGTDQPGNFIFAGSTTYQLSGGIWYAVNTSGPAITIYTAASPAGPWTAAGNISGLNGQLVLATGAFNSLGVQMVLTLAAGLISLAQPGFGPYTGVVFVPGKGLVAQLNSANETWNPMTLKNGWAGVAGNAANQYRLAAAPANSVEIIGAIAGNAATATTFATLPAGYVPASAQRFAAEGGTTGAPGIVCDTAGNLSLGGAPALPAAANWWYHGFISLDA